MVKTKFRGSKTCYIWTMISLLAKVICLAFKSISSSFKKKFRKSRIRIFIWIFTLWPNISVFGQDFVIDSEKKKAWRRNSFCPIKPLIPLPHGQLQLKGSWLPLSFWQKHRFLLLHMPPASVSYFEYTDQYYQRTLLCSKLCSHCLPLTQMKRTTVYR